MKRGIILALALFAVLRAAAVGAAGARPTEINVGYLLQRPTPAQFAQVKQTFDYALGVEVNWVAFDSGSDMTDALRNHQIQIAYSHGHAAFLAAVSQGLDLTMVGIAVAYPGDDNCIVRDGAGIDRASAAALAGQKIALQDGSVSHFRLLRLLEHFGVSRGQVEIVRTADGTATATALQAGEVVMGCASGGALRAIETLGRPLLDDDELDLLGMRLFDGISAPSAFVEEHPEIVQAFMDVVEAANGQWRKNPEPMRAAIARAAQMGREASDRALEGFRFPTALQQKSDDWLGRRVAEYSKQLADFFVAHEKLERALDSYEPFFSTGFLR